MKIRHRRQPAVKTLARDVRSGYDTLVPAGNQRPTAGVKYSSVAIPAVSSPSIDCPLFCPLESSVVAAVMML
jgi:hypothetical protein